MSAARKSSSRPSLTLPGVVELNDLLERRNNDPSCKVEIDREIVRRFQRTRAIFVLDMAGFSFSVRRHGIIHHLAKIHRMRVLVSEVTEALRGTVVKFEADNAFVTFATVDSAAKAALRVNELVIEANALTSKENHIEVAIGIGYGPILLADDDFYGDEVNLASKLGEDIAGHGEVLLTAAARKALRAKGHRFKPLNLSISGVRLRGSRLVLPEQPTLKPV